MPRPKKNVCTFATTPNTVYPFAILSISMSFAQYDREILLSFWLAFLGAIPPKFDVSLKTKNLARRRARNNFVT